MHHWNERTHLFWGFVYCRLYRMCFVVIAILLHSYQLRVEWCDIVIQLSVLVISRSIALIRGEYSVGYRPALLPRRAVLP